MYVIRYCYCCNQGMSTTVWICPDCVKQYQLKKESWNWNRFDDLPKRYQSSDPIPSWVMITILNHFYQVQAQDNPDLTFEEGF